MTSHRHKQHTQRPTNRERFLFVSYGPGLVLAAAEPCDQRQAYSPAYCDLPDTIAKAPPACLECGEPRFTPIAQGLWGPGYRRGLRRHMREQCAEVWHGY